MLDAQLVQMLANRDKKVPSFAFKHQGRVKSLSMDCYHSRISASLNLKFLSSYRHHGGHNGSISSNAVNVDVSIFFNQVPPSKASKATETQVLLGVDELKIGVLLRREYRGREIRCTSDSDWHCILIFADYSELEFKDAGGNSTVRSAQ